MPPSKPNSATAERRRSSQTSAPRKSSAANDLSAAQVEALQRAVTDARKDPDMEELLEVLCENNGWTLEGITKAPHLVHFVEVFLLNIPEIPVLKLFPNLTTVKLQHVALVTMADLKSLTNVEELWVTDNNITRIEGLDHMTNLRKLFLTGNKITSMDGLPCLKHLKELWLCRNRLTTLNNLDHMRKLRSFWVAENPLATLHGAFTSDMTKLHEVNLGGCQIASFTEIQQLAVLPCLRAVWFTDPLFGVSPVCQLNNYTTFVLHALPSLDRLDGAALTDEQRTTAASVYQKKALYYQTRMAALTRNYELLLNKASVAAARMLKQSLDATRDLKEVLLPIQYDLAERQMYSGSSITFQPDSAYPASTLEAAQRELRRAVGTREMEQSTVALRLADAVRESRQQLAHHLKRLTVELGTGGNARLEELNPDDAESWYASAKELLLARFEPERFQKAFGIDGVAVQRIFRVHNRGRRLYFDEQVKSLQVDLSEPYNRKRLVCLLSAVPKTTEAQRLLSEYALEHGFDTLDESAAASRSSLAGADSAAVLNALLRPASEGVPLTNSLFLADEGRLRAADADGALSGVNRDAKVLSGSIIVSRVFMGKNVAALGGRSSSTVATATGSASSGGEAQAFMTGAGSRVWKKDYSAGTFAAYRTPPDDNTAKVWHCFDRALVLPEFVVEYTYTSSKVGGLSSPTQPSLATRFASAEAWRGEMQRVLPEAPARDYDDLRDVAVPLMELLQWCGGGSSSSSHSDSPDGTSRAGDATAATVNTLTQVAQADTESALEAADALSAVVQSKEAASPSSPGPLTPAIVDAYFDALKNPSAPTFCQLRGRQLTAVPTDFAHPAFAALTALDLSKNQLSAVSWHAIALAAPALQHLNLSDNQLQCLNLCGSQLPSLLTLDVSFNQLDSLEEFRQVGASFPALESVHAEQNPCFQQRNAESIALSYLVTSCSRFEGLNGVQLAGLNRKRSRALDRHDRSLLLDESPAHSSTSNSTSLRGSKEGTGLMDIGTVSLQWFVDAVYDAWPATALHGPPDVRFDSVLDGLGAMAMSTRKKSQFLRSDLAERDKRKSTGGHSNGSGSSGASGGHVALASVSRLVICETLLHSLSWLTQVPNLQELVLCGNCLGDITPVLQLSKLERLNVQDNALTVVPRLSELKHLRELNLSDNRLTSLTPLGAPMKSLRRLSVNSNRLESLDIPLITSCEKLEELYVAANLLDSPKEFAGLRDMPCLASLDVCANPLSNGSDQAASEVREYLVYTLSKLKVLDGVPITPSESQRAQGTFAGKLSGDLLTERVREPQSRWGLLRELDLSRCALREVSLLSAFTLLEVLKLDHNGIVKIDGIASLRHLKALNLSHNKLGSTTIGYTGSVLKQIPTLESLSLEANSIQDMAHIALEQPELLFLNLKGNELQFVDHAFDRLPKLRELILDQNRIRAIGVQTFAGCRQLGTLSVDENALRTIDGVAQLSQLSSLSLGANRLAEMNQLTSDLANCPLSEAVFVGNPAARKTNYRMAVIAQFPRLVRLDQKDISAEERERAVTAKTTAYMAPPNVFIDMSYATMPAANSIGAPLGAAGQPNVLPPVQTQLRSMTANNGVGGGRALGQRGGIVGRGAARGGRRR